ncbi:hypothetical protein SESBI_30791 [Sesbania bispinosa]|nr:hypothetical protein SESBI_30791 [Sesbania bispinosa]
MDVAERRGGGGTLLVSGTASSGEGGTRAAGFRNCIDTEEKGRCNRCPRRSYASLHERGAAEKIEDGPCCCSTGTDLLLLLTAGRVWVRSGEGSRLSASLL